MSEVKLPLCSSCSKPIHPDRGGVKFPCPNCGKVVIWRCYRCRQLGNPYKCPICNFEGP